MANTARAPTDRSRAACSRDARTPDLVSRVRSRPARSTLGTPRSPGLHASRRRRSGSRAGRARRIALLAALVLAARADAAELIVTSSHGFAIGQRFGGVSTPIGDGILGVTIEGSAGGAAGLNQSLYSGDFEFEASFSGNGEVRFGSASGLVSAAASSLPDQILPRTGPPTPVYNGYTAEGDGILILRFRDRLTVTSPTLDPGTPVTLDATLLIDSSGFISDDDPACHRRVASALQLLLNGNFSGPMVEGSQLGVFPVPTSVGSSIDIEGYASAAVYTRAGPASGCDYRGDVMGTMALNEARVWLHAPEGVEIVSESGHDYTRAPESAGSGLAATLAIACRACVRRAHASRRAPRVRLDRTGSQ